MNGQHDDLHLAAVRNEGVAHTPLAEDVKTQHVTGTSSDEIRHGLATYLHDLKHRMFQVCIG